MKYKYLIFDVDGTLLDFNSAYSQAQQAVAQALKINFSPEFVRADDEWSWKLWDEFGLGDVEDLTIQQNYHKLYDRYLRKHFMCMADIFGVKVNIEEVLRAYYTALSSSRTAMESDTLGIYQSLSLHHKMIIATNGLSPVQRSRVIDFLPMTAGLYISEEIGSIKPSQEFFGRILMDFGAAPCDYLMIGDSVSSDMLGAKNIGMATCWYNFKNKPIPDGSTIDYSISKLSELYSIV